MAELLTCRGEHLLRVLNGGSASLTELFVVFFISCSNIPEYCSGLVYYQLTIHNSPTIYR